MVLMTLKKVWNIAICVPGLLGNHASKVRRFMSGQHIIMMKNMMEPMTLNSRCIIAARRALTEVPMQESSAVTQVPMLVPRTTYMTAFPPPPMMMPCVAMEMRMTVMAEEDCTMAVMAMPRKKSRKGLVMLAKRSTMTWLSLKNAIEPSMTSKPTKTRPRPATA